MLRIRYARCIDEPLNKPVDDTPLIVLSRLYSGRFFVMLFWKILEYHDKTKTANRGV